MGRRHYNYFRDYEPGTGRYVESDPIGLDGGMATYGYGAANPVMNFDPLGLFVPSTHNEITRAAVAYASGRCSGLPELVADADFLTNSQATGNSHWHAMRDGSPGSSDTVADAERKFSNFVDEQWKNCTCASLARALHALQDSFAKGHEGFKPWAGGIPTPSHVYNDSYPSDEVRKKAEKASADLIRKYDSNCVPGQCIQ